MYSNFCDIVKATPIRQGKKKSTQDLVKLEKIDDATVITDSLFKEMPDLFAPLATEYPPSDQKEKYESNGKQNNSDYFNNRRNKRRKESESYPRLRSLEEIKSSGKGRRNIDNVMNDSISRHDSREKQTL